MDAKDLRLECVHLAVKLNPQETYHQTATLGAMGSPRQVVNPAVEKILADATKIWEFVISTVPRSKAK